jgi:hypothetical protein
MRNHFLKRRLHERRKVSEITTPRLVDQRHPILLEFVVNAVVEPLKLGRAPVLEVRHQTQPRRPEH